MCTTVILAVVAYSMQFQVMSTECAFELSLFFFSDSLLKPHTH
jgi:hypothetical protein